MKYNDFIRYVSTMSGTDPVICKKVLEAVPKALMQAKVGERTVTPLGSFKMKRRRASLCTLPNGKQVQARGIIWAQLKSGKALKVRDDDPRWSFYQM